jgi:hypothetical protein
LDLVRTRILRFRGCDVKGKEEGRKKEGRRKEEGRKKCVYAQLHFGDMCESRYFVRVFT